MRRIASTKNSTVTKATQTIANAHIAVDPKPAREPILPDIKPRDMSTICVNGKKPSATTCKAKPLGMTLSGKKVPLSRNMGVMKRNVGKLKKSMADANDVKHMPNEAKSKPPTNATTGTRRAHQLETKPKAATTARTIVPFMVALVAPQSISPAITSSTLTGVAMMASNVFW